MFKKKDPKAEAVAEIAEKIKDLRDSFRSDLNSVKGDKELTLIVQSKIVALGQVLDEIGYVEEYPDLSKVLQKKDRNEVIKRLFGTSFYKDKVNTVFVSKEEPDMIFFSAKDKYTSTDIEKAYVDLGMLPGLEDYIIKDIELMDNPFLGLTAVDITKLEGIK